MRFLSPALISSLTPLNDQKQKITSLELSTSISLFHSFSLLSPEAVAGHARGHLLLEVVKQERERKRERENMSIFVFYFEFSGRQK